MPSLFRCVWGMGEEAEEEEAEGGESPALWNEKQNLIFYFKSKGRR